MRWVLTSVDIQRYECKDFLTILRCSDWQPCAHFRVETEDLSDARWSPACDTVAVWDSLLYYKILLYSVKGAKLGLYSAYADALGIKTVNWSPHGRYISVGSFNQVLPFLPPPLLSESVRSVFRSALY